MASWTPAELDEIESTDEIRVTSPRGDGTLRPFTIIWMARVGDDVYVRAAHGPETGWYRHARDAGSGRAEAGSVARDVRYETVDADDAALAADIDAAYHAKYDAKYPKQYVDPVVGHPDTLRVVAA